MLTRLHDNGEFTGTVLVARAGVPVYRDTIARTADEARELAAPSNIASLAKAFTAMAVMMLAEQGKVNYDDPIDKHLPDAGWRRPWNHDSSPAHAHVRHSRRRRSRHRSPQPARA